MARSLEELEPRAGNEREVQHRFVARYDLIQVALACDDERRRRPRRRSRPQNSDARQDVRDGSSGRVSPAHSRLSTSFATKALSRARAIRMDCPQLSPVAANRADCEHGAAERWPSRVARQMRPELPARARGRHQNQAANTMAACCGISKRNQTAKRDPTYDRVRHAGGVEHAGRRSGRTHQNQRSSSNGVSTPGSPGRDIVITR